MEARDAVYVVGGVHREWHPVQPALTDGAAEAVRVVRLARGTQDALQDGLQALAALLQGAQVVLAAVRLAVQRVEGAALQLAAALVAGEAVHVVATAHRLATAALTHYPENGTNGFLHLFVTIILQFLPLRTLRALSKVI